jgi:hypothetical protein
MTHPCHTTRLWPAYVAALAPDADGSRSAAHPPERVTARSLPPDPTGSATRVRRHLLITSGRVA